METILIIFYIYLFFLGLSSFMLAVIVAFENMPDYYPAKKWWRKHIISKQ